MVRNYKKKTIPTYDLTTLKQAVNEVKNGILSSYQASKKYNIPRSTISDRVNLRRGVVKETRGRPTEINAENERRLADGLHILEKYGFGLSPQETTLVVSNFIKYNKLKTSFHNNTPGYDWFVGFLKRNHLSLKKPQAVEMSRKTACDPFIINEYYNVLENCVTELEVLNRPERIWNLDESSFSKDPDKTKVVGRRGYASTRTIASAGKDNVTVLFTASAAGEKLPPLIIYRGKNVWDQWMSSRAFEGTTYAATKNGWIESKVFENYMFTTVLPHLSQNRPSLLVYDGHSTHIQLSILERASQMGVTIIKLPSHSSHLLQPLDLAVFKSMKCNWDKKILAWQRLNVGDKLKKNDFSQLLGEVWAELDPIIIKNGFKKAGIYPLNKLAIPRDKFDPESLKRFDEALKRNRQEDETIHTRNDVSSLKFLCLQKIIKLIYYSVQEKPQEFEHSKDRIILKPIDMNTTGTSKTNKNNRIQILEDRFLDQNEKISFESLLLATIKKGDSNLKVKKRKAARGCEVITRECYLSKLKEEEEDKKKKMIKKTEKKQPKKPKKKVKTIKRLKKMFESDSEEENDDIKSDSDRSDSDLLPTWEDFSTQFYEKADSESDTSIGARLPEDIVQDNIDKTLQIPIVGDWVLVKFATKKSVKHFIGNIISINGNGIPRVKFLRKNKTSKLQTFSYPHVEDVSDIKYYDTDIIMYLENPQITRRGQMIFKENFMSFNVQ